MTGIGTTEEKYLAAYDIIDKIRAEIGKVIVGKDREISLLLCALISGGHVLIEDVPGVGKTTLASSLAAATDLSFKRAQFTPDVMASDVTGFNVYNRKTEQFEFREGLVATNILLADEINRASPKTQSSLLEAMEERRVTVDGVSYDIPAPFMVIATQNPAGFVGTYPLPEAQLDRFSLRIRLGYPTESEEIAILQARVLDNPIKKVNKVALKEEIEFLRAMSKNVALSFEVEKYIVDLVASTRERKELALGASPRASLSLMNLSRAYALISHRHYVNPEDISLLFKSTVAHRVVLSREASSGKVSAEDVLGDILSTTHVPFMQKKNL